MSSALAIAAVTYVLKEVLQTRLTNNAWPHRHNLSALGMPDVTVLPPHRLAQATTKENRLNLFLYRVTLNAGRSNTGLPVQYANGQRIEPTLNATGERIGSAPLALDLYYLLTAYSQEDYISEALLGIGMQVFHEFPGLGRKTIENVLEGPLDKETEIRKLLAASNLDDPRVEQLHISPHALSTEEMSRLWSTFQAPYWPTVAYQVSLVLIEAQQQPQTTQVVYEPNVAALSPRQPRIDRVDYEYDPNTKPVVLVISGSQLSGERTRLLFGDADDRPGTPASSAAPLEEVDVQPGAGDRQIRVELEKTPSPLDVGMYRVQIVHYADIGLGEREVARSNIEKFRVLPGIDGDPIVENGVLTVKLTAPVKSTQEVTLLLIPDPASALPEDKTMIERKRDDPLGSDPDPSSTVRSSLQGVSKGPRVIEGTYFIRVRVNKLESKLAFQGLPGTPGTGGRPTGPKVEVL